PQRKRLLNRRCLRPRSSNHGCPWIQKPTKKTTVMLDHLSGANADVVLMNLQCAPAVLDQQERPTAATEEMLRIIGKISTEHDVALFRRFELMRNWHLDRGPL
ncbi:hypothetical protein AAFX91_42040, partial [Bradyrhizobium sp. 31Argb]